MLVLSYTLPTLLAYLTMTSANPTPADNQAPPTGVNVPGFHAAFVPKWLAFFNGNPSLIDELAVPEMITYLDRAPSPTGNGSIDVTINSRDAFVQGVAQIFAPFEKYSFEILAWTGATTHIAVRWTMHATLGKGGAMGSAKVGDEIAVNGTDFLWLDECSGKIVRYDLAVDSLSKFHQMGFTSITV